MRKLRATTSSPEAPVIETWEQAQAEIDRSVAKTRAHPDKVEDWFQMLPEESRNLLAFEAFRDLCRERH